MLKIQDFLRSGRSIDLLVEQYAIKCRRHSKYSNLCQFNYSQLDSPKLDPIVRECRGVILDEANNWKVVAYPYKRFFNHGEGGADLIDWASARVFDKLDGTLCILYYYKDEWHVATRGMPDASGEVSGLGFTFADLFWKTWNDLGYSLPQATHRCYMFELMTPYNRVVVQHKTCKLVLHGVRDRVSLWEVDPIPVAEVYKWEPVKTYSLSSWQDILAASQSLDPLQSEGFIVLDGSFNRNKVKSPAYVAIAHLKDGFSTRRLLEIVRMGESEEFLSVFPEWTELFLGIKEKYDLLVAQAELVWEQNKHLQSQKEFALAVKDLPFCGTLFQLRAGKIKTVREGFQNATIQGLERLLGVEYVSLGS